MKRSPILMKDAWLLLEDLFRHSTESVSASKYPVIPIFTKYLSCFSGMSLQEASEIIQIVHSCFLILVNQLSEWTVATMDQTLAFGAAALLFGQSATSNSSVRQSAYFLDFWRFYKSYQSRQTNYKKVRDFWAGDQFILRS